MYHDHYYHSASSPSLPLSLPLPLCAVALNYQTQDLPMDLNDGKFRQNGRAGYILKPRVQREGDTLCSLLLSFSFLPSPVYPLSLFLFLQSLVHLHYVTFACLLLSLQKCLDLTSMRSQCQDSTPSSTLSLYAIPLHSPTSTYSDSHPPPPPPPPSLSLSLSHLISFSFPLLLPSLSSR